MYELVYYVNGERLTKQAKDLGAIFKLAKDLQNFTFWLIFNPQGVLLYTDKDE